MNSAHRYPIISRRIQRGLWAWIGVILFFWISYDDPSTLGPIIVGAMITGVFSIHVAQRIFTRLGPASSLSISLFPLFGLIAGALAMPLAALSMLVKISLHGHVPPDFSVAQVLAVLGRTPNWSGSGALLGLAAALWMRHRRD